MLSDVEINVTTKYLGRQKQKNKLNAYVFSYTVTIENKSNTSIHLRRRYWLVTNGDGEKVEVSGDGVVGEQPIIEPTKSYEYTSASMLKTPVGTMEGYYEFELPDGNIEKAPIDAFSLALPNSIH